MSLNEETPFKVSEEDRKEIRAILERNSTEDRIGGGVIYADPPGVCIPL